MKRMHIQFGKDLLDAHITKFDVHNGIWTGRVENVEGEKVLNTGVRKIPLKEDTPLDLIITPLEYENKKYEELVVIREEIDKCAKKLYGENGYVTMLQRSGYSEVVIKDNIFVKEYTERFEKAKLRQFEIEQELEETNNYERDV